MRRPPNTANATTTCRTCGATIARSLATEPCPTTTLSPKPVDRLAYFEWVETPAEAEKAMLEGLSAFDHSFSQAHAAYMAGAKTR